MLRKVILMTAVLLLVMTGIASARPGVDNLTALQSDAADEEASVAPPVSTFILGERYSNGLFDLEVQDAFSVDSPLYGGYDEVRISAAFRHHTDVPWLPSGYAFTGEYGYPVLQLVDGAGEVHAIPTNVLPLWLEVVEESEPTEGAETAEPVITITPVKVGDFTYQTAGFALSMQPRGIPARWTVGFRVPSANNRDLVVQAVFGGTVLAEWDLESDPISTQGWDVPEGFDVASLGDSIPWNDELTIEPKAVAQEVCADPQFGYVSVDASLLIGVSSVSDRDTRWPAVEYPEMAAIAVWDDGTTAKLAYESPAFFEDDELLDVENWLQPHGTNVVVPPRTDHDRFMEFVAPRDGRFSDVDSEPIALVFYPPAGPPIWVDLNSSPSGSVGEFECDVPTWNLFMVDQDGPAPTPPPPDLEPETVFDVDLDG